MLSPGPATSRVVADTHVHLYPCYDLGVALPSLARNLARTPADAHAAFFAERSDCRAFEALRGGASPPPHSGVAVRTLPDPGCLLLAVDNEPPVYLFAGRQLVTAERLELLALLVTEPPPEGVEAALTIDTILAAGGVPVLGWSPGKWWGRRGRLARGLLEHFGDSLLLGDTALRPAGAPEPTLMREARRRGNGVIAGTDPLPLPGEERLLGSYASLFEGAIDAERPLESARRLLRPAATQAGTAGCRSRWAGAARRWLHNARAAGGGRTCAA